ncbi:MAG: PKD domain-containing protein [Patescibacteria group bacterium]|nr:PKD domain-containing protein [Patescibacteria group bacterium]
MDVIKTLVKKPLFQIGILLFAGGILFLFFTSKPSSYVIPEREDVRSQSISTAVISPQRGLWQRETFIAEIRDSVLRSELASFVPEVDGCEYIIQDLGTKTAAGGLRECGSSLIRVTVGESGVCSSSYQADDASYGKCRVSTRAFNTEGENSGWSSRTFQVDTISPVVSIVDSLPDVISPNIAYPIQASVSDNNHIIGCQLFVNREAVSVSVIQPVPCEDGNECTIAVAYTFENPGTHEVLFGCLDTAGNNGYGEAFYATVFINHPPEISSCRVTPTRGGVSALFQFSVQASDPDNDELSYLWDFGDGNTSTQFSPFHEYNQSGTYTPKVSVEDVDGESSTCSTAWVVVEDE